MNSKPGPSRRRLLRQPESSASVSDATSETKQSTSTRSKGADRQVLVVEDDPVVARLIENCIQKKVRHTRVHIAANGLEALDQLADIRFDLVLCDIMMPGMDGGRLIRSMAREPQTAGYRVVVLSAVAADRLVDILLLPNVVAHFQKPVDPLVLAREISTLLGT